MEHNEGLEPQEKEDKEGSIQDEVDRWIDQAEALIDEAADNVHQSEAYRKTGKSMESATLKIFRKAGRWWGKI